MKKIVVTDCLECPLMALKKCKEIKKLTPRQRVVLMTGVGVCGILKSCPLENNEE